MRILWTLLKVIIGLAIAIPLGIVALALSIGILGGLLALAVVALKLVVVGFLGYGLFKVTRRLLGGSAAPAAQPARSLPMPDPYYEAAMRDLDREMGGSRGR